MISRQKLFVIVLIIVGLGVYAFNLNNQLFWDDDDWIKSNVFVHDFSHIKEIFTQNILSGFGLNSNYYRPALLLSFAVNYALQEAKPFGYHLLSNGFHIASGILIFVIISGILGGLTAFLAALLFIIHPVQTEAVTYISGRGDPMSVFFMLLALWLFIKIRQSNSKLIFIVTSLASMILAVLSRETAIVFPLLLVVFFVSFLSKSNFYASLRKSFFVALPYILISASYFIMRLTILNFENTLNFYSTANEYTQHLSYRLYTFGHALIEYFRLIFIPIRLHMERDLAIVKSPLEWPVITALFILLAIIFIGSFLFKKAKQNSESYRVGARVWLFGWGWFFIALGPASGVIPINALMYEHWLYLPSIGLFVIAGFYLTIFFKIISSNKLWRGILVVLLVVYFSFFAIQSIKRNILWGNSEKFYNDILKYNPYSVRILNNLGMLYSSQGKLDQATQLYLRAINSPSGNIFAQPHYNLGNVYRDQKEWDKAVEEYQKAVSVDPSFPFAYQNLSVIYAANGQLDRAAIMLEKVKTLKPLDPWVYYNLSLIYIAQNNIELAIQNLNLASKYAKGDPRIEVEIHKLKERFR